ncbi:hypothetical protein UNDYM_1439 [Undibacterium sp. YM2]|nr:hypothetical protein UNDYM_1439 [Undibacterium sp. YM2]
MKNSNAEAWVIDDGESEITPIYTMTHTDGQDFTFVRADFWFWDSKKSIKLAPTGSITVNGIELKGESGLRGTITYVGKVPLTEGELTFKLIRNAKQSMTHTFVLPTLNILEYPKSYKPHESIRVPVKHTLSALGKTTYDMIIRTPQREFDLTSQIQGDYLDFIPIIKLPLPVGIFEARIFKQHRTPLRDISDASKTGWAVASNGKNFKVEILDPN